LFDIVLSNKVPHLKLVFVSTFHHFAELLAKNFLCIEGRTKYLFNYTVTSLLLVYLVDIYNIIEAFRENGLNTLDAKDEIDEPRLECIIASIFYSLYKRLPVKTDIDVEKCILILTQWIMHAYDR